jgi:AsmA protein
MRLLGLAGVLLLLAAIVAVYLLVTFDPNAYKSRIEERFAEATGRQLTLAGRIDLTLFPTLGLRLEDVRVANAEGFGDAPFAQLRVVDVAVAALPLLRGELEVQRIGGDGVAVYLVRRADGRSNWEDLVEGIRANQDVPAAGPPGAAGSGGSNRPRGLSPEDILVSGVDLTDLRIEWDDRKQGARMTLAPANLRIRGFRPGVDSPLNFDGLARFEPDEGKPTVAELSLEALLNVDFAAGRYLLRRAGADLRLQTPMLESELEARIETDLLFDQAASLLRAEPLSVSFPDLRLTGLTEVSALGTAQPMLRVELRSNRFDPREVLASMGIDAPETTDPDALRGMALDFSASGDRNRLVLDPLLLELDESSLRGDAVLERSGTRPALRFELAGDRLDLDRYLPPGVEKARTVEPAPVPRTDRPAAPPDTAKKAGEESAEPEAPVERRLAALLRALDIDGSLTLGRLTLLGLTLEGIELTLRARDGEWRVEPLTGNAYEGRLESRAALDTRGGVPHYDLAVTLEGVAIGPLLEAMRGGESRLLGNGSLALAVAASGANTDAVTSSLNGQGQMNFVDGAVRGINIARIIRQADARLRGEVPEDDGEPNQTDFTELHASFRIVDGVVRNDDLVASSPLLRVAGSGSANLPAKLLDYRVEATLVATIEGQGGRSLDQLQGANLPIHITGPFAEPRFRLDLEDVARERLEDKVRREADRLLDRLGIGDAPDSEPSEVGRPGDRLDRLRDQLRGLR